MGLAIHYHLKTLLTKPSDVRALVETLREHARDLPFKEVDEIVEFDGADCSYEDLSGALILGVCQSYCISRLRRSYE